MLDVAQKETSVVDVWRKHASDMHQRITAEI